MADATTPDDPELALLARRAGLARALADHPGDVAAAARAAAGFAARLKQAVDDAAEPWPPMRVPDAGGRDE